jgi:hypothetical protein
LAYIQKVGKEAESTYKSLWKLNTVEELGESFMATVSDLWRTADELIEKFSPVFNRVFNIRE